jgi:TM2 domain-containing membrane protein YozV
MAEKISKKEKLIALLLAILGIFGVAGIHRLYAEKIGTGILWLITIGWFGIGTIVDIVMIANGAFRDKNGAFLRR